MMRFKALANTLVTAAAALSIGTAVAVPPSGKITVSVYQGRLLVNQGEQFRPWTEGMNLKIGDRLIANEGSRVTLNFPDGCVYDMVADTRLTLGKQSPCVKPQESAAETLALPFIGPVTVPVVVAGVVFTGAVVGVIVDSGDGGGGGGGGGSTGGGTIFTSGGQTSISN